MFRAGKPLIYFISHGSINDQNYNAKSAELLSLLSKVVSANIPLAQIREKQLSTRLLLDLVCRVVSVTHGSQTNLLINDRLDVALASGADGVHLTARSLQPDVVRGAAAAGFIIGISTHSLDEVRQAAASGADLAVFGPVFETPAKGPAAGLEALGDAVKIGNGMPVLGLGGVEETNYRDVLASGAAGFAAIRFLNDSQSLDKLHTEFNL